LEIFDLEPEVKHLGSLPLKDGRALVIGEAGLCYVLAGDQLLVLSLELDGAVLLRQIPLADGTQLVAVGEHLYALSKNSITAFGLTRPWAPERLGSKAGVSWRQLGHWGKFVTAIGSAGTQMLQWNAKSGLEHVAAEFPKGHWADSWATDRHHRHIFRLLPENKGFELWRLERRNARTQK
jgi:hypothetical protein